MARMTKEEAAARSAELNYSRLFTPWKVSSHEGVPIIVERLFNEIPRYPVIRSPEKYRRILTALCLDLFTSYESDPSTFLAYSRTSNDHTNGSRYQSSFLSYRIQKAVTDFLSERGYVLDAIGMKHPDMIDGRLSRIRANDSLVQLFHAEGVTLADIEEDPEEEVIVLRDESDDKNDIEYDDTDQTRQMRANLEVINQCLKDHTILLELTNDGFRYLAEEIRPRQYEKDNDILPVDFSRKRLRRIFNNNSFEQGGRFYGGYWQGIPKEYRKHITINDKYTCELDYSGLHVNMLYAMDGLDLLEGDPYELEGYSKTVRNLLKRAMLILVNANSRPKALKAIRKEVNFGNYPGIRSSDEVLNPIFDAFIQKHDPIRDYFFSGIGSTLQYYDSQISERLMLEFAANNLALLPMHDSYIVFIGYEEVLKERMDRAFFDMFNRHCQIKPKESVLKNSPKNLLDQQEYKVLFSNYRKLLNGGELVP